MLPLYDWYLPRQDNAMLGTSLIYWMTDIHTNFSMLYIIIMVLFKIIISYMFVNCFKYIFVNHCYMIKKYVHFVLSKKNNRKR